LEKKVEEGRGMKEGVEVELQPETGYHSPS
jgi:hypothetical protein